MASPAWPGITSTRNCLTKHLLEKRFYELHSVHKYEYEASKVPVSLADFFNSGDLSPPMGPSSARGYEVRNGCARTNRDLVDDFSSCCSFDGEISGYAQL